MCFPTRTESGQANLRGDHVPGQWSSFSFNFDLATRIAHTQHAKNAHEYVVIDPGEPIPQAHIETLSEWASRPKYTAPIDPSDLEPASKFGCFDCFDDDFDF